MGGAQSFNNNSGSLNFGSNQTTKTITVNPKNDTTVEADETLRLALVNGNGYTAVNPTNATGTILNDDVNPNSISLGSVSPSLLDINSINSV